ncbi:hypothetical protein PS914_00772 [Pseudomonas fluorescens]|uniref:hypothetical protein n=1 Tax=Pseudomonas fluorescens TaxID=294 RepID=UPI00123F43C3|nr:hypothetical protein [Pseudomonas fluorescens]VVP68821.1 hypothetical protein PS914_00772 [Pseudomonas fluorescens]
MQHAFALSLIDFPSSSSASDTYSSATTSSHTSIIDDFRIDKATGEIYGEFATSTYQPSTEQYQAGTPRLIFTSVQHAQPMVVARIDNVVYVDFRATNEDDVAPSEIAPEKNPRGAGRKPASTVNPIAYLAVELLMDVPADKPLWLDNIIFGSCLTAAGQSQNVCNVSMNEVVGALYLKEFKVDVLVAQGTPLRKAQRIIKAARHAAHGIHCYLVRRPKLLQVYEDAAKLEASLAPSNCSRALYASTVGSTVH